MQSYYNYLTRIVCVSITYFSPNFMKPVLLIWNKNKTKYYSDCNSKSTYYRTCIYGSKIQTNCVIALPYNIVMYKLSMDVDNTPRRIHMLWYLLTQFIESEREQLARNNILITYVSISSIHILAFNYHPSALIWLWHSNIKIVTE